MNGNAPRRMADVRLGKDACFDAWLYNLFIDNNLVHDLNTIVPGASSCALCGPS